MSGNLYHFPETVGPSPDYLEPFQPESTGAGLAYRCAEKGCRWTGHGGAAAFDHHRIDHHEIVLRDMPTRPVEFSCCATTDERRVAFDGCRNCQAEPGEPCAPWCREDLDVTERDDNN